MACPEKMARLAYRGPDFDIDGVVVRRFVVPEDDDKTFEQFVAELPHVAMGRGCDPGTYAALSVDGKLWMSDTTAEKNDHLMPIAVADMAPGGRGLVTGLGLGCVVAAMLDSLDHVDVIERDWRVVETIGAWYKGTYGDRVEIIHADAYAYRWPGGQRWDVVWHDIWPSLSAKNLTGMAKLRNRYRSRAVWQGCWGFEECKWMRQVERNDARQIASLLGTKRTNARIRPR